VIPPFLQTYLTDVGGSAAAACAIIIANWQTCDTKGRGERAEGQGGAAVLRQWLRGREGVAETRPRADVLAGEEGTRRGAVVGDGGAGVRGGTKLRGFIGEELCLY